MIILENEPLKKHSYIRIGGPAKRFVHVDSHEDLVKIIKIEKDLGNPYYLIGEGSNILFSDNGYNGTIIKMTGISGVEISGNIVRVKAGTRLPELVQLLLSAGLSGMEQLCEIPGSVGGAVAGNAGAFGREIGELFEEGVIVDHNGNLRRVTRDQLQFSYRTSRLKSYGVIIEATFRLVPSTPETIRKAIEEFKLRRREAQPVGELTLGSVFKNPKGISAGYLLDRVGLKGYSIGGAKFSEKHANFIVNFNNAKAEDVISLIREGVNRVRNAFNIELETEIIMLEENSCFS
jgi:UDP-N-acetylmuramate dehydrogenase